MAHVDQTFLENVFLHLGRVDEIFLRTATEYLNLVAKGYRRRHFSQLQRPVFYLP
jgi:hypothetical protein